MDQRIATAPDILLAAEDEPLTTALPFYTSFGRSISFDQANFTLFPNPTTGAVAPKEA